MRSHLGLQWARDKNSIVGADEGLNRGFLDPHVGEKKTYVGLEFVGWIGTRLAAWADASRLFHLLACLRARGAWLPRWRRSAGTRGV